MLSKLEEQATNLWAKNITPRYVLMDEKSFTQFCSYMRPKERFVLVKKSILERIKEKFYKKENPKLTKIHLYSCCLDILEVKTDKTIVEVVA